MEWKNCVEPEEIPDNGVLLARVSDDVLDDDCWTPFAVVLTNGIITFMATDEEYYLQIVGQHKKALADWTRNEDWGTYPTTYYELFI